MKTISVSLAIILLASIASAQTTQQAKRSEKQAYSRLTVTPPEGYEEYRYDQEAIHSFIEKTILPEENLPHQALSVPFRSSTFSIVVKAEYAQPLAAALKQKIKSMPVSERLAKLDENRKAQEDLIPKSQALNLEYEASSHLFEEKFKSMQLERQQIDVDLFAKQKRREALAAAIEQAQKEMKQTSSDDPVGQELQKLIDARQAALDRVKTLYKSGATSTEDVNKAEGDLAEAKVRLIERRETLQQSASADIIRKFTEELASIVVDVAELEARKSYIASQFPDLATMTASQLDALVKNASSLVLPKMPPIFDELSRQSSQLENERAMLLITDVKVSPVSPK